MNQTQERNFNSLEVASLTPLEPAEADGKTEERKSMIQDALYSLNECISSLYSLDEKLIAMDLEEFRQSIADLKEA
ncbi:hypothetical protein ACWG0P_08965 [Amedibacillus sp. YH-ame6]